MQVKELEDALQAKDSTIQALEQKVCLQGTCIPHIITMPGLCLAWYRAQSHSAQLRCLLVQERSGYSFASCSPTVLMQVADAEGALKAAMARVTELEGCPAAAPEPTEAAPQVAKDTVC